MRQLVSLAVCTAALLASAPAANAFCGFYVAKADAKLFNKASKVVVARKGEHTVVTMASDYEGDPREFALVIPVPEIVKKEQIHVTENKLVDHIDAYSAPRLVEYHDPDPCAPIVAYDALGAAGGIRMSAAPAAIREERAKSLGVTIEAEYTVGEYDILILSAKESDGLATWLDQEGYRTPAGAAPVLASYLKQGMKFFVAKVNLTEKDKLGFQYLRPIQVAYETRKFMLPVRLGTVNANGPQDLLVFMLTEKGRVETTNYRSRRIPSDLNVPIFTRNEFGAFYKAMFDRQVAQDGMRAVYLEYAWNMAWCDPCAADPVPSDKLVELGAFWLLDGQNGVPPQPGRIMPAPGLPQQVFLTRLHVRYDAEHFPEDLMFQETGDTANFQGRYVLNHPWRGEAKCAMADAYRKGLTSRFSEEADNLARLTGWDIADIRRKMAANGQAIDATAPGMPAGETPWYQRMWGGKK